jgi:flagellar protein FlgJ
MSIAIGNNSLLTNMAANVNTSDAANKLDAKLKSDLEKSTDDELMDVCKSFESYFVEQVFKEMKKTVPQVEEENEYMSYFGDMLYEKYSENIADRGNLGIAQMLYESMKRN